MGMGWGLFLLVQTPQSAQRSHDRRVDLEIFRSLRLLTQAHPAKADENLALFQRRFCRFRERVAKIQLRRHLLEAPRRCKELAGEGGDRLQEFWVN
ncbi:hypothetical protein Celaphus_00011527 [Cervus elaphus hippelaphus]|uniref:Uncharacterized protein n=1 Tax=Cervus elaphus hippelaphus TaxID=46360 RepID=A0A212DFU6_CEREH|nr:hypothetical protein Celaphus_00011527 [Cervus elaphus hippelaphus]